MLFGNHNPEKSLEKGKSSVKITAWDLGSLVLAVGSWENFRQVEVKTQRKKTVNSVNLAFLGSDCFTLSKLLQIEKQVTTGPPF